MPTDTIDNRTPGVSFALRAAAWSLGLFGLLRLNWVEIHGLLPLTRLQGRLADGFCDTCTVSVSATLACSGADALALCAGAILAYPARWRARLAGAVGGILFILALNTLRIGTLGRVAASPAWFDALHLYVWPAVLVVAGAGYVVAWMYVADRGPWSRSRRDTAVAHLKAAPSARVPARPLPRFIVLAVAFLLVFTIASPLYLESAGVLTVAAFIARAAAAALRLLGVDAHAAGNMLLTSRGSFAVTQECISTPLIPIYLAAVCAWAGTWRERAAGIAAAAPLFIALGIARLLVVALPVALVAAPLTLVHGFYQFVLAAAIVAAAAVWRHDASRTALRRALAGVSLGIVAGLLLDAPSGYALTRLGDLIGTSAYAPDPQGAVRLLPAFQVGLFVALWVAAFAVAGWRRFLAGLAGLLLIQVAFLLALALLARYAGITVHVRDVRAWAVAGPLLVLATVEYRRLAHDGSVRPPGAEDLMAVAGRPADPPAPGVGG